MGGLRVSEWMGESEYVGGAKVKRSRGCIVALCVLLCNKMHGFCSASLLKLTASLSPVLAKRASQPSSVRAGGCGGYCGEEFIITGIYISLFLSLQFTGGF